MVLAAGLIAVAGGVPGRVFLAATATAHARGPHPATRAQSSAVPVLTISVSDGRSAAWTVTAAATNFITGAGSPDETVPATDVTYDPGTITHTGTITVAGTTITMSKSVSQLRSGQNYITGYIIRTMRA